MSKRTNQTAAKVMKLAHSIKSQFATFSAALKAAWAQIKQPAKTAVSIVVSQLTGSEKQIKYASDLIAKLQSAINARIAELETNVKKCVEREITRGKPSLTLPAVRDELAKSVFHANQIAEMLSAVTSAKEIIESYEIADLTRNAYKLRTARVVWNIAQRVCKYSTAKINAIPSYN